MIDEAFIDIDNSINMKNEIYQSHS